MLNLVYEGKNIFNPLDDEIMDDIIDGFVRFYGEDKRERITTKLKEDATYFFLSSLNSRSFDPSIANHLKYKLSSKLNAITKDIMQEFATKQDLTLNEDKFYSMPSPEGISNTIDAIKNKDISWKNKSTIKDFYESLNKLSNIEDKIIKNDDGSLSIDKKTEKKIIKDFNNFLKIYHAKYEKDYTKILDDIEYVEESGKSLSIDESVQNQEVSKLYQKTSMLFQPILTQIYGEEKLDEFKKLHRFQQNEMIDFFYKYYSQNKNFENTFINADYIPQPTKRCLNFLDINDDFNLTIESVQKQKLMQLLNDENTKAQMKEISTEYSKALIKASPYMNEIFNKLKSLNTDSCLHELYSSVYDYVAQPIIFGAFVNSFINKDDQLKSICCCPTADELTFNNLIHEMNHIVDTRLIENNKDSYTIATGFEILHEPKSKKYTCNITSLYDEQVKNESLTPLAKSGKRQYEALNEVVNEYFAQIISKDLAEHNVIVGTYSTHSGASYSDAFPIMKNFIDRHIDLLKECRLSNDPYAFANEIGKDNFEKLATLADDILDNINSFTYLNIRDNTVETQGEILPLSEYRDKKYSAYWNEDAKKIFAFQDRMDNLEKQIDAELAKQSPEKQINNAQINKLSSNQFMH